MRDDWLCLDMKKTALVITVSDGVHAGSRDDRSGEVAVQELKQRGFCILAQETVPDDVQLIVHCIQKWTRQPVDLVLTTGGTGLGPRDVTPEAVRPLLDREIPGYGELLRSDGLRHTPMAVLSRSFAGTIGRTLIIVLPGNPKAVGEGLQAVGPTLHHALDLLAGETKHQSSERVRD